MKKIVLLVMIIFSVPLWGQNAEDYYELFKTESQPKSFFDMNVGYEYNSTYGSSVAADFTYRYNIKEWLCWDFGVRLSSEDLYQAQTGFDFKWLVDENYSRKVGFFNKNLYSLYAVENFQDLLFSLAFQYEQDYFYFSVGAYERMFGNVVKPENGRIDTFWEFGLLYDFGFMVRPNRSVWNLGAHLTNNRRYYVERMPIPNFIINGYYRLKGPGSENFKIFYELGSQPAGMFNIVVNYYSFYANIGLVCAF